MRYSAFAILKNALRGNQDWTPAWRKPEPRKNYDVIVVGDFVIGFRGFEGFYYDVFY